jgi:uncharacterized FlaG/YvyC family protein
LKGDEMKKIFLSIIIILPFIFMSCSNKVTDENKPNEETNITENNNKPQENNEIEEEKPNDEQNKNNETSEKENEITEVISPIESVIDSRFGYLEFIYPDNGDYYVDLDEAEIFFGEEALNEALLDSKEIHDEDGKTFVNNGYYVRNNYDMLSTFKISKDAKFYLCGFALEGEKNDNSIDLYEVSLGEFRKYTAKEFELGQFRTGASRCKIWIDIQDGVAIKLYQQFTP